MAGVDGTLVEIRDPLIGIESELRERFLRDAHVRDPEKGYVSAPSVNQEIDPVSQALAADLIAENTRRMGVQLDAVIGIPASGNALAAVVADRLKGGPSLILARKMPPGLKEPDVPGSWKDSVSIVRNVPSFTSGTPSDMAFNRLRGKRSVLVVEDVIATGSALESLAEEFRNLGVEEIYAATYLAKLFQGGVDRVRKLGIEPFCAIGIDSLAQGEDGIWKPVLAPPNFS
jgi:adenine/guanine phosphoribosyltransferase-like PRPP-binding protein